MLGPTQTTGGLFRLTGRAGEDFVNLIVTVVVLTVANFNGSRRADGETFGLIGAVIVVQAGQRLHRAAGRPMSILAGQYPFFTSGGTGLGVSVNDPVAVVVKPVTDLFRDEVDLRAHHLPVQAGPETFLAFTKESRDHTAASFSADVVVNEVVAVVVNAVANLSHRAGFYVGNT